MNKFSIIFIILILSGVICFAVAGYSFQTLNDLYETLANYNLESQYYTNPKTIKMVFDLKFGIVKYSIAGFLAWIGAGIFFLKRRKYALSEK